MTTEEAIRILDPDTTSEALAETEYNGGFRGVEAKVASCDEACRIAVAALRAQQAREKQKIWHKYPEKKPTDEKDYCVIRQYHSQGQTDHEEVKDGEIWVEMDYWHNGSDNWHGWESIGTNNPFWETLYWIDLGRTEITPPVDLPGKVTRMFGEAVPQADELREEADHGEV